MPDQDVGGYVYERAYFHFRHQPPEALSGQRLENHIKQELEPMEEALDLLMQPELEDALAFEYAIEMLVAYDRHGFYYRGNKSEQPSLYLYALDCVLTARERAHREERAVEASIRNAEARDREQNQGQTGAYGTSDLG